MLDQDQRSTFPTVARWVPMRKMVLFRDMVSPDLEAEQSHRREFKKHLSW